MIWQIYIFLAAIVVSFLLTFLVVKLAGFLKASQVVREEGPESHQKKTGTLTMGGVGFILATISLSFVLLDFELDQRYFALILLAAGYALVGLFDDLLKILRRQNQGLTFWQKIISQVIIAGGFSFFLHSYAAYPLWLVPFAVFVIVGAANATNLTDGLDGLLAGTGLIAFFAFAFVANGLLSPELMTFSLVFAGSLAAFLFFNFPRAKIFMGDVGSLPIGATLAGVAIILRQELLLVLIGGVFVIETLSVIIQVGSFKLFKKRVFRMAPLHHHFELLGFAEVQIVVGFWIIAAVLGIIGVSIM